MERKKQRSVEGNEGRETQAESLTIIGLPRAFNPKASAACMTTIGLLFLFFLYRRHRLSFSWPYERQQISAYSEGSFYYSFFGDVVSAPTWTEGLRVLLNDERSEHPDVINALRRFNVYQELLAGLLYRGVRALLGDSGMTLYIARTPFNFYTACVFLLQAFGVAVLAGLAAVTGGSAFCAIACFGFFFANYFHRLIVRVQAVPLRENWALPFLWMNVAAVVMLLQAHAQRQRLSLKIWQARRRGDDQGSAWLPASRRQASATAALRKRENYLLVVLFVSTLLLLLFWQFGVFALTTQVAALFAVALIGFPVERLLRRMLLVLLGAFVVNVLLQFVPRYLLLSFLPHTLVSVLAVLYASSAFRERRTQAEAASKTRRFFASLSLLSRNFIRGLVAVGLCFLIRASLRSFDKDDSHVFQLLLYKLGLAPSSFDTQIYLMGGTEFEFFSLYFFNLIAPSRLFVFAGAGLFVFLLLASEQLLFLHRVHRLAPGLYASLNEESLNESIDDNDRKGVCGDPTGDKKHDKKFCHSASPRSRREQAANSSAFQIAGDGDVRRRGKTAAAAKETEASSEDEDAATLAAKKRKDAEKKRKRLEEQLVSSVVLTPDLFYLAVQTLLFLALMLLIARLRVLCLPLLCVAAAAVASPAIWRSLACAFAGCFNLPLISRVASRLAGGRLCRSRFWGVVHLLLFSAGSLVPFYIKLPVEEMTGVAPTTEDAATPSRLSLVKWIQENLPADVAILGDMPSSSTLRAATSARLIIHPQFEQVEMRRRVQFLYGASACPPEDLYATMAHRVFAADYLLISNFRCAQASENRISVFSVADMVEEKAFRCPPAVNPFARFCFKVQLESSAFELVYRSGTYALLKVKGTKDERAGEQALASKDARREEARRLKGMLRQVDLQKKNESYLSFDWKHKVAKLDTFNPWLKHCVKDDTRCGRDIQEFAQELLDMYGLQEMSRLLQEKAVELFPRDPDVLFGYGVFLDFDMHDAGNATLYYERGVDLDPMDFGKIVQFVLFLDHASGRRRAIAAVDRVLYLEQILDAKTDFELAKDASSICKAAMLLNQLVHAQVQAGDMREKAYFINEQRRVMRRFWEKSKALNIQSECVVESWEHMENTKLTTARRVLHFFVGENALFSLFV
ncbi:hypothetical protein BESB_056920 [Besnoitia besnoiti]|uniref:Q-cell neuroblast polarization protein n=1 Tax=Besnoitia besnoiti TaxID=94643 RepID=A0A2A9MIF7_BESBE|nr:hypothetical protein BESB_056920 [Besnoitia besnoiti]PFH36041.1 hypothetical protein BESB_056920 [Besnoitia besnoiti]